MPRKRLLVPVPRLVLWRETFHISWTDPTTGTTKRRSLNTSDRTAAEKIFNPTWQAILAEGVAPTPTYALGDLIKAYDQHRGPKRDSTFYALRPLSSYFSAFTPAQLRNDAVWTQYRAWRTAQTNGSAATLATGTVKPVSDSTAVRELNVLRAVLSYGRRNGWDGLADVKVHIPDSGFEPVTAYLSREEAMRLIDACEPHQALFVRLALATGARMSAVLQLKWTDISWPLGASPDDLPQQDAVKVLTGKESLPTTKSRADHLGLAGETITLAGPMQINLGAGHGNKRRGVGAISASNVGLYLALIEAYRKRKSDHVIEWHGRGLTTIDLTKAYTRAGLTGHARHNHILKHTCCSWLVQSGVSFEAVAKLVGTRANIIERVYGHLSARHLAAVGEVLSLD